MATGENRILAILAARNSADAVLAAVRRRRFRPGDVLQLEQEEIRHIFFPVSGLLSLLAVVSNGDAVEAASVGREGMAGLPVFLGGRIAATRTVAQLTTDAYVLDAEVFRRELRTNTVLSQVIARYAEYLFEAAAQTTACNRLHPVLERTARAILGWCDRLEVDRLRMTQVALADALGVRRPSVTQALTELTTMGAIARSRGIVVVLDRPLLESQSCECYATVGAALERATN